MQRESVRVQHSKWGKLLRPWLLALVVLLGALTVSVVASATTVIEIDTATQLTRTDLVVMGEVTDQRTFRAEDGAVYTDTTLRIDDVLHGASDKKGADVVIRQMGGEFEGVTYIIPGDARFTKGETAVVFLADRDPASGVLYLTQLAQSKWSVMGTTADGDAILSRDLAGLTFYDANAEKPLQEATNDALTLNGLRAEIKAATGGEQ